MDVLMVFAFALLFLLFAAIVYQIRETTPAKRTVHVTTESEPRMLTWDSAFVAITPSFLLSPASLRAPIAYPKYLQDASGNLI